MYTIFEKLSTLPVASLLDAISEHTLAGGISIINSETGSGKTLSVPLRIQKDTGDTVFVIEPRRFLAINAAETLAQLSETVLGEEFGYLIGAAGDEENRFSRTKTKLGFATYGFALATKMIMDADRLFFDEIHEHSIDMAICKALVKWRYLNGTPPKSLTLMSASIDAEVELAYWNDVAPTKIFSAGTGRKFKCDRIHLPATHPGLAALSLAEEDRRGILVFAPGVGEIQEIMKVISENIKPDLHPKIILTSIHGQSTSQERRLALSSPPEDYTKILVGTNVIESGMNLDWVDAGVTTGDKKELHVRPGSGAIVLSKVPLVKANVDQQAGRTNRFQDSKFVICGTKSYDQMTTTSTPEIERLPLTALYMHCQSIDIDPDDLQFMPQPSHEKMKEAATKLKNLGFFDEKLKFTHAGLFAQNLPVGLETAAMLYHACCTDILADVIPMAAMFEIGSIRKDHSFQHGFDSTSDVLDGTLAFVKGVEIQSNQKYTRFDKTELMEHHNIGHKRYLDVVQVVKALEQRFNVSANYDVWQRRLNNVERNGSLDIFRQCILAASVCDMGVQKSGFKGDTIFSAGSISGMGVSVSKGSAVGSVYDPTPVSFKLRMITPRSGGMPFMISEHVTQFSMEVIEAFSRIRAGVFTREMLRHDGYSYLVNGVEYLFKRVEHAMQDDRFSIQSRIPEPQMDSGVSWELSLKRPLSVVLKSYRRHQKIL